MKIFSRTFKTNLHSQKRFLLPPSNTNKKCLILDLDETLVHSIVDYNLKAHIKIPPSSILIKQGYSIKRPHVDSFLDTLAIDFEVIVFTAGLQHYADPLIDKLDVNKVG